MAKKPVRRKRLRAPSDTAAGRVALLLEQIQEQNKATIEAVFAAEKRIRDDFGQRFDSLERRVAALEFVVKQHSEQLGRLESRMDGLESRMDRLEAEVRELKDAVSRIAGRLDEFATRAELKALEQRVAALEQRVGN